MKVTSKDVCNALQRLHMSDKDWVFFTELRVGTGFTTNSDQRIDAWAMHTLPSKKFERVAYEVKVSRQDFLNELKQPQKRRHALLFSNRFYFATPAGLIKREELPAECGLYELEEDGTLTHVVAAPWRDPIGASWSVVASVLRRIEGKEMQTLKEELLKTQQQVRNLESRNAILTRTIGA